MGLRSAAPSLEVTGSDRDDAVVTDVGSAKSRVVADAQAVMGGRFVGGHPMAGSERHGMSAADPRLFDGAWWILTPTSQTTSTAYARVSSMVGLLGATPIALSPETHDDLVARVSHVPQLTASALVEMAGASADREALLGLAAAGFRDVTRIAASHPGLWTGIIKSNHEAVLEALGRLRAELGSVGRLIEERRWEDLEAFLEGARRARVEVFAKPDFGGDPIALWMMVPDRPGVLAEVTTAAGRLGANIEDLRIVHSTEGGKGRLEVIVAGRAPAELPLGALVRLGSGKSRAGGLNPGDDVERSLAAVRALGADVHAEGSGNSRELIVRGRGPGGLAEPCDVIDAGTSGTTLRILLG